MIQLGVMSLNSLLLLLTVAFFTLFERKVMGTFHIRLGPKKLSFLGLVQPLLDALKLFTKSNLLPNLSNKVYFMGLPMITLVLSVITFNLIPTAFNSIAYSYSLLGFLTLSSVLVFGILISGWMSNSKYSLLGSLRSIAQSISYESVFNTILLIVLTISYSYSISKSSDMSNLIFYVIFPIWLICVLGETHRAPFDFSEAESELVSGFNTEFGGFKFSFLFLSEYIMLLFNSILMALLFGGGLPLAPILYLKSLGFSFLLIWIRITFCRFRYDLLMSMAWKLLLPISLFLFLWGLILI